MLRHDVVQIPLILTDDCVGNFRSIKQENHATVVINDDWYLSVRRNDVAETRYIQLYKCVKGYSCTI